MYIIIELATGIILTNAEGKIYFFRYEDNASEVAQDLSVDDANGHVTHVVRFIDPKEFLRSLQEVGVQ